MIKYRYAQMGGVNRMLTAEENKIIMENHNLIYWYATHRHLDIDEWYGALAIELCITANKHDMEKGSFATLFKLRCDNMLATIYRKGGSELNISDLSSSFDEHYENLEFTEDDIAKIELRYDVANMDYTTQMVVKYKLKGMTQSEVAEQIGISQSNVSKILSKLKEDYIND